MRPDCRVLALLGVSALLAGCGASVNDPSAEPERRGLPEIVVTLPVLGSLVEELVGDAASVRVLMRTGVDPHDWQPSPADVEAIREGDLVVVNGLGLEESLGAVLGEAQHDGALVFRASDHVELQPAACCEASHGGTGHEPPSSDPHFWTDPLAVRAVVDSLVPVLERRLAIDVAERGQDLGRRLAELDAEVARRLSAIPEADRRLVTSHESLGYFAHRYGFVLVGAFVPSFSSQAEASAGELADLGRRIEELGVPVVFSEVGDSTELAESIGRDHGVAVVALPSHNLAADGSYFTFVRGIADAIAGALGR